MGTDINIVFSDECIEDFNPPDEQWCHEYEYDSREEKILFDQDFNQRLCKGQIDEIEIKAGKYEFEEIYKECKKIILDNLKEDNILNPHDLIWVDMNLYVAHFIANCDKKYVYIWYD